MNTQSKKYWLAAIPSLLLSVIMLLFYPFYLNPLFQEEIIEGSQELSKIVSNYFIERYLPENILALDKHQFDKHEASIKKDVGIFNLWKIKIFNSEGVIIYSTIKDEIDTRNQKPFFVDIVAKGKILSKMEKKGGNTFVGDKIVPYDVVETYVPIMKDNTFIGAFEIYLNVSDEMQRLKELFWSAYIIIVIIVFTLSALIILFSLKISKSVKEREKLLLELQVALVEVKTLQGIIPICSGCKKIRDDKGYWNQIEAYIKEHSEADFSHGICPDCAKKLYPDLKIYDN